MTGLPLSPLPVCLPFVHFGAGADGGFRKSCNFAHRVLQSEESVTERAGPSIRITVLVTDRGLRENNSIISVQFSVFIPCFEFTVDHE